MPASNGLSLAEQQSARALAHITGGSIVPRDVGSAQGVHDFDIELPDGRRAAVEHTSLAHEQEFATARALRDSDHRLPAVGSWSWTLSIPPGCSVNQLKLHYGRVLADCEQEGICQLDPQFPGVMTQGRSQDLDWFMASGVRAFQVPSVQPPTVHVLMHGVGDWVDTQLSQLDAQLREVFARPRIDDHVRKVLKVVADEHHLFLGISMHALPASLYGGLLDPDRMPTEPAPLPPGLSHLWLSASTTRIIQATSHGWSIHEVPFDVIHTSEPI